MTFQKSAPGRFFVEKVNDMKPRKPLLFRKIPVGKFCRKMELRPFGKAAAVWANSPFLKIFQEGLSNRGYIPEGAI